MSPTYIHEINHDFEILDGFYARLLINLNGLFDYVISKGGNGMTKREIFDLIGMIRSNEQTNLLIELRNCYYQTGFLVFVDDLKNVFIYNEDDEKFLSWFENAYDDGPSSKDVYENFDVIF